MRGLMVIGVVMVSGVLAVGIATSNDDDSKNEPPPRVEAQLEQSVETALANTDWTDDDGDTIVDINTGAENGNRVAVELPGGFGFKLPADKVVTENADFDIDGVGPYPGAKLGAMRVRVLKKPAADGARALVDLAFTSPDNPAKVLDWYAHAFETENIPITRDSRSIRGQTKDEKRFQITVVDSEGGTQGTIRTRAKRDRS